MSTKRITVYYSLNQVGFWMVFCLSSSFAAVYLGALGYSNTKLGSMLALGSVLGFLLGTGLSSFVDTSPRFNAADVLWPVLTLQASFCCFSRRAASLRRCAIRCCWRSLSR